jgi:hypothetical protein
MGRAGGCGVSPSNLQNWLGHQDVDDVLLSTLAFFDCPVAQPLGEKRIQATTVRISEFRHGLPGSSGLKLNRIEDVTSACILQRRNGVEKPERVLQERRLQPDMH